MERTYVRQSLQPELLEKGWSPAWCSCGLVQKRKIVQFDCKRRVREVIAEGGKLRLDLVTVGLATAKNVTT